MGWNITKQDKLLRVDVDGRLVAAVAPELREDILSQMEDGTNVLFDLSKMVHIDSSGLGALVSILQRVNTNGGVIKLACLQPRPRIVFDITKICRVFDIYDTVDEAIASFK